jgi:hypothetical protein
MFGDNLSMISDTIMATQSLRELKDKFKINLFIASCRGDYHRFIPLLRFKFRDCHS